MHCGAGSEGAGTLATGILVTMGVALPEAEAHVGAHRSMVGPELGCKTSFWSRCDNATHIAGRPEPAAFLQDAEGQPGRSVKPTCVRGRFPFRALPRNTLTPTSAELASAHR